MRGDSEQEFVDYVSARLPALHRAAYLLCGDAHRADDIAQTTATALYRHWRRAKNADNLDAYVHRMLVHTYLDEQRRGWPRVRLMAAPPEPAAQPASAAESASAAVEDRSALRTALAALPRTQRTVLILRFACDLSVQDVAGILRCSQSNVKSHTARGLAALRGVLGVPGVQQPNS